MALKDELLNIRKDIDKKGIQQSKRILKLYKTERDIILAELAKMITQYYDDGFNFSDIEKFTILATLEQFINERILHLKDSQVELIYSLLTDSFKDFYYSTADIINGGLTISIDFGLLKDEFIKASIERPIEGKDFSARIWNNTNQLAQRIKQDIQESIEQGLSPYKIATRIKQDFNSSAYQAKRLVNTELAKTVMSAQDEIYTNMKEVQQVMWDATLESNTCDYCRSLDGKYFDKYNHPTLPAHPNCRCCIVPVVEGWKPRQKRFYTTNDNKRVSDITTYKKLN